MCPQSQDVHTPRVIASVFLAIDAWRIHPPLICTAPAQAFMDEVDGRPGHVALQSGHLDAPQDVPTLSLCLSIPLSSRNHKTHPPEDWPHRGWPRTSSHHQGETS